MKPKLTNLVIYAVFLLIAVVGIIYGSKIQYNYTFIRIWQSDNILLLILAIPFLFFQNEVGIPNFLESNIKNTQRFIYPLCFGMIFGILDIIVIKVLMHPESYRELPPFLQPFPYSIFLYFSGAFEIEVFYRLIPLSIICLIGKKVLKGQYYSQFIFSGMILTSLREPIEQLPNGSIWFIGYSIISGFLMNLLEAVYFKNVGFLGSLSVRLGHYLFWHIILGIYVQYFEL